MTTLKPLLLYSLQPALYRVRCWWAQQKESYYLMSMHVEEQRAREHQANARYYAAKAATARSNRL
jgi:hypothetical protein